MDFKIWSEINTKAKEELCPSLGLRGWDSLNAEEKNILWDYFKHYFNRANNQRDIFMAVLQLNANNKYKSYGKNLLSDFSVENAVLDFKEIFLYQKCDVLLEMLSYFCESLLKARDGKFLPRSYYENSNDEEYNKINLDWQYEEFDEFKGIINDNFEQFGVDVFLTRSGFAPVQEKEITNEIYEPVITALSDKKWEVANRELKDAFKEYQRKQKEGYSNAITHAISAVEAFLQIAVYGQTGKGTLGSLIKEAIAKGVIQNDLFSNKIFDNIDGILAQERMNTGDAHPKKEYATEKNSRLVLDLVMVFLHNCIQ